MPKILFRKKESDTIGTRNKNELTRLKRMSQSVFIKNLALA